MRAIAVSLSLPYRTTLLGYLTACQMIASKRATRLLASSAACRCCGPSSARPALYARAYARTRARAKSRWARRACARLLIRLLTVVTTDHSTVNQRKTHDTEGCTVPFIF
jgi:hypothetical protein